MGNAVPPSVPIEQQLEQIHDLLRRIQAQLNLTPAKVSSPFLPLAAAAEALHYRSADALRADIQRGKIPTKFISARTGKTGLRTRYLVDVEGYIAHLRQRGRR